jgi:predicted nuclease of predicted toxin-antitoxin system
MMHSKDKDFYNLWLIFGSAAHIWLKLGKGPELYIL